MLNFFIYSEWISEPEDFFIKNTEINPNYVSNVFKCPWNTLWRKEKLEEYGYIYCLEIDKAILYGFNPKLKIEVNSLLSKGDSQCYFVWKNAKFTEADVKKIEIQRKEIQNFALANWEYHTSHLFKVLFSEITNYYSVEAKYIINEVLEDFGSKFGIKFKNKILANLDIDFTTLEYFNY